MKNSLSAVFLRVRRNFHRTIPAGFILALFGIGLVGIGYVRRKRP
jgi:hypothetical protein